MRTQLIIVGITSSMIVAGFAYWYFFTGNTKLLEVQGEAQHIKSVQIDTCHLTTHRSCPYDFTSFNGKGNYNIVRRYSEMKSRTVTRNGKSETEWYSETYCDYYEWTYLREDQKSGNISLNIDWPSSYYQYAENNSSYCYHGNMRKSHITEYGEIRVKSIEQNPSFYTFETSVSDAKTYKKKEVIQATVTHSGSILTQTIVRE